MNASSDVTIVVNAAIESVNHFFLEELTAQAIRDDCAIVGGTILQPDGRVLSAGLACRHDGTWINAYEGMGHEALGYMGLSKVVREVASIVPHAFAFRTSRLHVSGGARVRLDRLNDLCAAIVNAGHRDGLKVLHTPYAVMTLREREAFHPGEMGGGAARVDAEPESRRLSGALERAPGGNPLMAPVVPGGGRMVTIVIPAFGAASQLESASRASRSTPRATAPSSSRTMRRRTGAWPTWRSHSSRGCACPT